MRQYIGSDEGCKLIPNVVNEIIIVHNTNYIDRNIIKVALSIAFARQNINLIDWINQLAKDYGIIFTSATIAEAMDNTVISSVNKMATTESTMQFYETVMPRLHSTSEQK